MESKIDYEWKHDVGEKEEKKGPRFNAKKIIRDWLDRNCTSKLVKIHGEECHKRIRVVHNR